MSNASPVRSRGLAGLTLLALLAGCGNGREAAPAAIDAVRDAGLDSLLFWGSLAFALVVAGLVARPLNYWLIARGRGHAVVHGHHAH